MIIKIILKIINYLPFFVYFIRKNFKEYAYGN